MILKLLQLSSSTLPLGAYSYSEGLETAIDSDLIKHDTRTDGKRDRDLLEWLTQELHYGAIRIESALMLRSYRCLIAGDLEGLREWNQWGSAAKETSELRQQSWQMGNTLTRLLLELDKVRSYPANSNLDLATAVKKVGKPCNYAIAFGIGAAYWQIEEYTAILGYLHSWATNLINVGVKLIPLGQTKGQQLLWELHPDIESTATAILKLKDDDLYSCSWGLGLASMMHETQYSRLFRS